jgi:hypothetical protein
VSFALVWLFAVTLGPLFLYLPPRFQPRWLYHLMLGSVFTAWAGLGIVAMIFREPGFLHRTPGVILGVLSILVG